MKFSKYLNNNGLHAYFPDAIPGHHCPETIEGALSWQLESDELSRINHYMDAINEIRNGDTYQLTRTGVDASQCVARLVSLMFVQVSVWANG